jgi:glycosyltransferase involved in cell wall biosynthesis
LEELEMEILPGCLSPGMIEAYPGRVGLQQRVLPEYRAPFFDCLAQICAGGLGVFAGQPLPVEQIRTTATLHHAKFFRAHNRHFLHPASPLYQCWQAGFLAWLQEWQPDVLIVEANPRYPITRQAIGWMHAHNRPVIGWGLGLSSISGGPSLAGLLASFRRRQRLELVRSLDAVIAYSQTGAEQYRRSGVAAERVFVALNAVTPRPAQPPLHRSLAPGEKPLVLFVGRLQARKRIDLLLQACASLPAETQPRLCVVGDGPARLEMEARARDVYPQAQFLGARHGAELETLFDSADLFVLPGTGGLAVQQAMAHGLPVIVAQGDGTQDDLVREANGWRIPPGDLQALITVLQTALGDVERLHRMGGESYRIVSEEVNLEEMVAVFLRAIKAVGHPPNS